MTQPTTRQLPNQVSVSPPPVMPKHPRGCVRFSYDPEPGALSDVILYLLGYDVPLPARRPPDPAPDAGAPSPPVLGQKAPLSG